MEPVTVIFSGPQGSGKGTQVSLLKEFLARGGMPILHVEMGGLLRSIVRTGSYAGKHIANIIDAGNILPSFIPVSIFTRELFDKFTGKEHLIFDGVARRVEQSQMLNDELGFFGRTPYDVVLLEISKEESLKRLKERASIEGRIDDLDEERVLRRLGWYEEHVVPALQEFEKLGQRVHYVDGLGTVEEVHKRVLAALGLAK